MLFFIGELESKKEDIRYGRAVEGNSYTQEIKFVSFSPYKDKTLADIKGNDKQSDVKCVKCLRSPAVCCSVYGGFGWHHLSPLCSAGCGMCQHFDGAASEPSAFICIHKCLLCYAQEGINKNLLLSVNERSTQTRAAALKIDLTEGHCSLFKWTSLLRSGLCVTQWEGSALYVFMWMQLDLFYCNKLKAQIDSVKPDYVSSLRPGYTLCDFNNPSLQSQFTASYTVRYESNKLGYNIEFAVFWLYDENTNWTHHRWTHVNEQQ